MSTPVKDLEGATDELVAKLAERGIADNEQLVQAASTPAQRKELAGFCGCETGDILHLANRADLARIRGIGGVYSDLLEIAGVDTVKELAARRADKLHAKVSETNDRDKLTTKPPTMAMVQDWVAQAKALKSSLSY
jgi:nucleotidyltransferase/DNA polymerase involved in DNA repair